MTTSITPTKFQTDILSAPEDHNLFLGGGRGGGKTFGCILLILEHCERYGAYAHVLVTRKRQKSLTQFVETLRPFVSGSFNSQLGVFRLDNGATITVTHCENQAAVADAAQGMSFTLIFCDEAGEAPAPDVMDNLMLSLRSPSVSNCRMVIAANPGGPNHAPLNERFVQGHAPFDSFMIGDEKWLYLPSTVDMNPYLDARYHKRFTQMRDRDPARYEALRYGNWSAIVGAFLQGVWDGERMILPEGSVKPRDCRTLKIGADWGTASPAYFGLFGVVDYDLRLQDDRVIPEGAFVLLDELAEVDPHNINKGTGRSPYEIAPDLWAMCRYWQTRPVGWIDSAADARTQGRRQTTVTQSFQERSCAIKPANKRGSRADRANLLRDLLSRNLFYVSERAKYWLATVPSLARDELNPEVPQKGSTDHAYDATTYLIQQLMNSNQVVTGNWRGSRKFAEPPAITKIPHRIRR